LADALEVIEGIVELVAVAGLVRETLFKAGFEIFAPPGELVVILFRPGHGERRRGGSEGGGLGGHERGAKGSVYWPGDFGRQAWREIFLREAPARVFLSLAWVGAAGTTSLYQ
jgi:hypothetical protein